MNYIQHMYPISYERSNWQYLVHLPAIRRLIRRIQPDLVNAHFLSSYGLLGALTCPKRIPYVISLYGSDILVIPERSPIHRLAARFSLSRASLVISVSENMTKTLKRYLPDRVPVLTTQYGINLDMFHPQDGDAPREPLCLSTRALVNISDLETLLTAAKTLHGEGEHYQFIVAGEGELKEHLAALVKTYNLQEYVAFVGKIEADKMPEMYQKAAIYVSTSLSDGSSLSLLEAMACGAFPVVADIPANREWIEHGVNGYLFKPGSSAELAGCINEAWKNLDLRNTAADKNRQIVQQKANYLLNLRAIEQAYISLERNFKK
jgi:glycosyltransferase involved in cell wall biosynthesis